MPLNRIYGALFYKSFFRNKPTPFYRCHIKPNVNALVMLVNYSQERMKHFRGEEKHTSVYIFQNQSESHILQRNPPMVGILFVSFSTC